MVCRAAEADIQDLARRAPTARGGGLRDGAIASAAATTARKTPRSTWAGIAHLAPGCGRAAIAGLPNPTIPAGLARYVSDYRAPTAEEVAAMREETELRNAEYAAREAERQDDEDAGGSD